VGRLIKSICNISLLRKKSIVPGFVPTFSFTLFYLSLIVLIPLGGLILNSTRMTWDQFYETITTPRALAAFRISFGLSFLAALISAFFGIIIAWVLVRYRFPGRRLFDAIIDLPFAIPTSVSGITLATIYSEKGWLGEHLASLGIKVAFTPLGILLALIFIGFPFLVRSVQPAIEEIDREVEEAAICLGASRWQTIGYVIFPQLTPSLLTGFIMALARALGEYGSVIFIAGNIPFISEIVPLLIVIKLEQFDYQGATALAVAMLTASFLLLLSINLLQMLFKNRDKRMEK
jgi:sulfate transport system permease protein